jgi:hypothetical protein
MVTALRLYEGHSAVKWVSESLSCLCACGGVRVSVRGGHPPAMDGRRNGIPGWTPPWVSLVELVGEAVLISLRWTRVSKGSGCLWVVVMIMVVVGGGAGRLMWGGLRLHSEMRRSGPQDSVRGRELPLTLGASRDRRETFEGPPGFASVARRHLGEGVWGWCWRSRRRPLAVRLCSLASAWTERSHATSADGL